MIYEVWFVDGGWKELQWTTTNIFEADLLFDYGRRVCSQFNDTMRCMLKSREATKDEMVKKADSVA